MATNLMRIPPTSISGLIIPRGEFYYSCISSSMLLIFIFLLFCRNMSSDDFSLMNCVLNSEVSCFDREQSTVSFEGGAPYWAYNFEKVFFKIST